MSERECVREKREREERERGVEEDGSGRSGREE